jgi:glutamate formiminotransferase/formiminotetrahydrofolate cyclodeaminase
LNLKPILECVPNFSEGRDRNKINAITEEIRKVPGVKLLHVDIGNDAHRTVVTFSGDPDAVVEAAFLACKKATEVIDMRQHKGVHPRFGAIDVLPFIPVKGITMDETVQLTRKLAFRLGNELGIHVYCYEYAAFREERRNLASCRAGEYEGLEAKIKDPEWKPDFGPGIFNAKTGATAIGARKFLIAYNVNLNTGNINIAKSIAGRIRESGIPEYAAKTNGEQLKKRTPGKFKGLKAIGWYIPEYGKVQVSTNITDMDKAPIHEVFEEIKRLSTQYNVEVTGSEIIGLIPMKPLLEAGRFYLQSSGISEKNDRDTLDWAIFSLGLNDVKPFIKEQRIIEYLIGHG